MSRGSWRLEPAALGALPVHLILGDRKDDKGFQNIGTAVAGPLGPRLGRTETESGKWSSEASQMKLDWLPWVSQANATNLALSGKLHFQDRSLKN